MSLFKIFDDLISAHSHPVVLISGHSPASCVCGMYMCVCAGTIFLHCIAQVCKETLVFLHCVFQTKQNATLGRLKLWRLELPSPAEKAGHQVFAEKRHLETCSSSIAVLSLVPAVMVLCFLPLWQSYFGFLPLG